MVGTAYSSSRNEAGYINVGSLPFANQIVFVDGMAMVPIRQAAACVPAEVCWYPEDNHIEIHDKNNTLNVLLGEDTGYLNNMPIPMNPVVSIIENKSYISLRILYESFGYTVGCDNNMQSMYIKPGRKDAAKAQAKTNPTPAGCSIQIGAIGDCILGTDPNFLYKGSFNEAEDNHDPSYFFSGVQHLLAGQDLTIANLETTLTNACQHVDKSFQGDQAFYFKGYPYNAHILKNANIDAVTIANNHSFDFGTQGMQDTIQNLAAAGIGYCGYGRNYITEVKGCKIGLLGYNDIGPIEEGTDLRTEKWHIANDIKSLRQQGCQIVIVYVHWGVERTYGPTDRQQYLGHFTIDSGADLVLGAHPHVVQPIEKYKGRYIAYSLGNFCYGGNNNPSDKDTFIFQGTFMISKGKVIDTQMNIVPCSVSSSPAYNDYRPMVLTGSDASRVISKIYCLIDTAKSVAGGMNY